MNEEPLILDQLKRSYITEFKGELRAALARVVDGETESIEHAITLAHRHGVASAMSFWAALFEISTGAKPCHLVIEMRDDPPEHVTEVYVGGGSALVEPGLFWFDSDETCIHVLVAPRLGTFHVGIKAKRWIDPMDPENKGFWDVTNSSCESVLSFDYPWVEDTRPLMAMAG